MQNYNVVFSDLAIADLNDIVQYITEKESYTRAKYVERESKPIYSPNMSKQFQSRKG